MSSRCWPVLVIPLAILATGRSARAQINTEKLRALKAKPGAHGYLEGGVLWQTGNTDLLQASVGARLEYVRGVHRPFLQATYALGQKSGARFVHNGFLHARWPAMWHRRVGSEVFAQLEFNEFKLQRLRALAGAGVRVAVLLRSRIHVHLGTGYMFEYEDLDLPDLDLPPMAGLAGRRHPARTYSHRWTSYASVRVSVSKWLSLSNVAYAQPRFDRFADLRVLEDFAATFTVYKRLKLELSFVLSYDSDPPIEVAPLDTKLLTKLKVTF